MPFPRKSDYFFTRRNQSFARMALAAICVGAWFTALQFAGAQKLPKQEQIDKDVQYVRDPDTGELHAVPKGAASAAPQSPGTAPMIRSNVRLIEIGCSAISSGGEPLQDLKLEDFELSANAEPQKLVHLDRSDEPAHIVLVVDASPSEFHSLETMKDAAHALAKEISPRDEIAVVAFAGHPHLLLPFTTDRRQLDAALDSVKLLRAIEESGSNIYGAVYFATQKLFTGPHAPPGRKAILLLTDGQDSGLGLSWNPASMYPAKGAAGNRLTFEDVVRELSAAGVGIYIASTENRPPVMTGGWFQAHMDATLISDDSRLAGIPAYTIFLAELVRRVGGGLYFLREVGTLSEVYRRIGALLRAEYILGFYPEGNAERAGWHSVVVGLSQPDSHPGARLFCRPSYYIPAGQ
jgi:Ca-activated chloride channel homolog